MYLLKPNTLLAYVLSFSHLHSTMYLLKPAFFLCNFLLRLIFTFHYVSIKTLGFTSLALNLSKFTFHYVSIKTRGLK